MSKQATIIAKLGTQMCLKVENLSFSYTKKKILENLSFELAPGQITSLIGTSGSGKSTLFKLLGGFLKPHSGTLFSPPHAYMMQEDLLLPWRNVLDNILLPYELGPTPKKAPHTQALNLLEKVNLLPFAHSYPHELSAGMRQRVALIRTLLQEKPLILLDEPFNSLDILNKEEIYTLLLSLRTNTTLFLITHDFKDAITLSNRILLLSNGHITHEWNLSPSTRLDPIAKSNLEEEMALALKGR